MTDRPSYAEQYLAALRAAAALLTPETPKAEARRLLRRTFPGGKQRSGYRYKVWIKCKRQVLEELAERGANPYA